MKLPFPEAKPFDQELQPEGPVLVKPTWTTCHNIRFQNSCSRKWFVAKWNEIGIVYHMAQLSHLSHVISIRKREYPLSDHFHWSGSDHCPAYRIISLLLWGFVGGSSSFSIMSGLFVTELRPPSFFLPLNSSSHGHVKNTELLNPVWMQFSFTEEGVNHNRKKKKLVGGECWRGGWLVRSWIFL